MRFTVSTGQAVWKVRFSWAKRQVRQGAPERRGRGDLQSQVLFGAPPGRKGTIGPQGNGRKQRVISESKGVALEARVWRSQARQSVRGARVCSLPGRSRCARRPCHCKVPAKRVVKRSCGALERSLSQLSKDLPSSAYSGQRGTDRCRHDCSVQTPRRATCWSSASPAARAAARRRSRGWCAACWRPWSRWVGHSPFGPCSVVTCS